MQLFNLIYFQREEELEEINQGYNVTSCCVEAGVNDLCAPLCSYDASMNQVKTLAPMCAGEIHKILRCGAGGRNHGACCTRRGVPPNCSSICAGVLSGGFMETAAQCIPYIGNIVQCFEEGEFLPSLFTCKHLDIMFCIFLMTFWKVIFSLLRVH